MNVPNLTKLIRYLWAYEKMDPKMRPHQFQLRELSMLDGKIIDIRNMAAALREHGPDLVLDPLGCAYAAGVSAGLERPQDWFAYCEAALMPVPNGLARAPFDWCFASFWQVGDPTPIGCAKRIAFLLEKGNDGLPPMIFRDRRTRYDYGAWAAAYAETELEPYLEGLL